MPIPNKPLLWLCAVWLVLGLAAVVVPDLVLVWQIAGAGLLAVGLADLIAGRQRRGSVTVSREVPHALPVGTWQTVALRLTSRARLCGWLSDRHPDVFGDVGLPLFFRL